MSIFNRACKKFEDLYGVKPNLVWLGEGSEDIVGIARRTGMRILPGDGRDGRPLVRKRYYVLQAGSSNY
jgi:hypothetical protein